MTRPCTPLIPPLSPPYPALIPPLSPPYLPLVPPLSPPYPPLVPPLSPPYPPLIPPLSRPCPTLIQPLSPLVPPLSRPLSPLVPPLSRPLSSSTPQSDCKDDDALCAAAGADLTQQPFDIADWLVKWAQTIPADAPVVIGNYTYLDGDMHVKVGRAPTPFMLLQDSTNHTLLITLDSSLYPSHNILLITNNILLC